MTSLSKFPRLIYSLLTHRNSSTFISCNKVEYRGKRLEKDKRANLKDAATSICLSLAFFFLITTTASCKAENTTPYKARTLQECTEDQDCVWAALEPMVLSEDTLAAERVMDGLQRQELASRWTKPINIKLVGEDRNKFRAPLNNLIATVIDFVPNDINYDSPFNFLIIFSSNMELDLKERYRKQFQNMTGDDSIYESFKAVQKYSSDDCFFSRYDEEGEMLAFFMFVDLTSSPNYCLVQNFYAGLGNKGTLENFSYSGLRETTTDQPKLGPLDLLLLKIFYRLPYSEGDTRQELKEKFLNIYPEILKEYSYSKTRDMQEE